MQISTLTDENNLDVDECAMSSTLCSQKCENTIGSYMCSCNDGFTLMPGTNQCKGDPPFTYNYRTLIVIQACITAKITYLASTDNIASVYIKLHR